MIREILDSCKIFCVTRETPNHKAIFPTHSDCWYYTRVQVKKNFFRFMERGEGDLKKFSKW